MFYLSSLMALNAGLAYEVRKVLEGMKEIKIRSVASEAREALDNYEAQKLENSFTLEDVFLSEEYSKVIERNRKRIRREITIINIEINICQHT